MKYSYTWNHIALFAKLCKTIDDDDSVTSSWIKIVESHHASTFPFTLWPLKYRTSDVTTSPSICSPVIMSFIDCQPEIHVKIYVSNEVIIVCVQNGKIYDNICEVPSLIQTKSNTNDHSCHVDEAKRAEALLPCTINKVYSLIKDDVLRHIYRCIYESQNETTESIRCVICTGHGMSSSLASCLASDMGNQYETQKEFLGLEERSVNIDFVGFSSPPLGSRKYWESHHGHIDNYISIGETFSKPVRNGVMVSNPFVSYVSLNEKNRNKVSMSMSNIRSKISSDKKQDNLKITEYIECIEKKIILDIE